MEPVRLVLPIIETKSYRVNLVVTPVPVVKAAIEVAKVVTQIENTIRRSILRLF